MLNLVSPALFTVTTSGTPAQLQSTSARTRYVVFQTSSNTGVITIGDENVNASIGRGITLATTDEYILDIGNEAIDLSNVYVDGANNDDTLSYSYLEVIGRNG